MAWGHSSPTDVRGTEVTEVRGTEVTEVRRGPHAGVPGRWRGGGRVSQSVQTNTRRTSSGMNGT